LATLRTGEVGVFDTLGVKQIMATLIYVLKTGGVKQELRLNKAEYLKNPVNLPNKIEMRFENSGNVHLIPRGKVEIKNSKGNIISKGIINQMSVKIMPESFRLFEVKMEKYKSWIFPGKYTLEINYRFDGADNFVTQSETVNYFGKEGAMVSILLLSLVGIFLWKYLV